MENNIIEVIKSKGAKLNRWQTFVLALLVVFTTIFIITTSFSKNQKLNKTLDSTIESNNKTVIALNELNSSIDKLQKTLDLQNRNNLAYDEACYIYKITFDKSKYKIIEMIMNTITRNHIDREDRQVVIGKTFTIFISNIYVDDYSKLSKFKYNEHYLSSSLDKIDTTILTNNILIILFDSTISHEQRRTDLIDYLNNQFNQYYQQSIKQLQ